MARRADPMKAALAMRQFAAAGKELLAAAALEAVQDIAEQVIVRSPLKTGFLMSSWFATIGTPALEGIRGSAAGAGGAALSTARIAATLLDYQLGQTIWLQNGTAYAARLEFGFVGEDSLGRTYNQAPRAWVRGVIDEAPGIAVAAAARVAAGQSGGANPGGGGRLAGRGYVAP